MANNYKRRAVWGKLENPPSSRPILIYFEFRSKPSLITIICMDPYSPIKLFGTCKILFSRTRRWYEFLFLLYFSFFFLLIFVCFVFLLFYVIINFYKNYLVLFYIFIFFIFFRSGMFRNVAACSGMFRVPSFIDARCGAVVLRPVQWAKGP